MKIKVEQAIYLGLAFLFAAAFMWFIQAPGIATAISGVFVFVVGSFLGVDLVRMIKDTKKLPKGEFEKADKWRYLMSMVFLVLLTAEAIVLAKLFGREVAGIYGTVGVGAMVVIGLLITGIEANKAVTNETNVE